MLKGLVLVFFFTGLLFFKMTNGFYTFLVHKPPLVMGIISLFVTMLGFYSVGTYIRNNKIEDPNISEVTDFYIFAFLCSLYLISYK